MTRLFLSPFVFIVTMNFSACGEAQSPAALDLTPERTIGGVDKSDVSKESADVIIDPILEEWASNVSAELLANFDYTDDESGRAQALKDFKISFETGGLSREDLRELEAVVPNSLDELAKLPKSYVQVHLILDSFVVDKAHDFITGLADTIED